jgi:hypothetical protein
MLTKRHDGTLVKDLKFLRAFVPYLQKTRTESQVSMNKRIEIDKTLEYLEMTNRSRGKKISLFQVFISAGVRTLALRPELNRFVSGRKIYQRKAIIFSFALKKSMTEEANVSHAKITFSPDDNLFQVVEKIEGELRVKREPGLTADEREMLFFLKLPRFLIRLLVKMGGWADFYGLLPRFMIENDPLFASVFCANLGSIGMDAVTHHLFNWGNVSMFATMGKIDKTPSVDETGEIRVKNAVDVIFTLDNRISDGLYLSNAIDIYLDFIQNPEKLEKPLSISSDQ